MKNTMKNAAAQIAFFAAAAAVAALVGCKSIEVERHAQTLATYTDTNGVVRAVCDDAGKPVVLDGGWEVDYFQHWNWQKFDTLSATAGTGVALSINNYASGADSNLVALVHASLDGLTKLVVAAADAYVKVAGGGAQADTAINVAQKAVSCFDAAGGDVSKATVTTDEDAKAFTISDGSTTVECDKDGSCNVVNVQPAAGENLNHVEQVETGRDGDVSQTP